MLRSSWTRQKENCRIEKHNDGWTNSSQIKNEIIFQNRWFISSEGESKFINVYMELIAFPWVSSLFYYDVLNFVSMYVDDHSLCFLHGLIETFFFLQIFHSRHISIIWSQIQRTLFFFRQNRSMHFLLAQKPFYIGLGE